MAGLKAVGFRLREKRKTLGFTQADLAEKLDISASYVNLMESGKRPVSDQMLERLANVLQIDRETLAGPDTDSLIDSMQELLVDPAFRSEGLSRTAASELTAVYPHWAQTVARLYQAYTQQLAVNSALADRLSQDPHMADTMHQMLSSITSIRSAAEILTDTDTIETREREQFQRIISQQSLQLTDTARALITQLENTGSDSSTVSAVDQVDGFIVHHRSYFEELESCAEQLTQRLGSLGDSVEVALQRFLQNHLSITVATVTRDPQRQQHFRHDCWWSKDNGTLYVLESASGSTRRFQLATLLAQRLFVREISDVINQSVVAVDLARPQIEQYLARYIAGALLLPYYEFYTDAVRLRYDMEALQRKYRASFEQVAHRLVTLRRQNAEGIPFAFLRADQAGYISKRFPLPGLMLPRAGNACPLWVVYSAFAYPAQVMHQQVELDDRSRYLFIARTVGDSSTYSASPRVLSAVMLACELPYAKDTVYGASAVDQGLSVAVPVGTSCRLCGRNMCRHRQMASLVRSGDSGPGGLAL